VISPSFAAVILAAGESSRMGTEKALLPWEGSTFLTAAIERLTPFVELIVIVAGANAESLKQTVYAKGGYLVVNPEPQRGQFSSLQVGLNEVLNRGRDAALVTHVDRPAAKSGTIALLKDTFVTHAARGQWAVVPECADPARGEMKHGHPIAVGRELIEVFLRAPATSVARDIEHANQARISYLPVTDTAVITNVNTPEEYERLVQQSGVSAR
jgi:molybdenum cofactor cytidylyltransferase